MTKISCHWPGELFIQFAFFTDPVSISCNCFTNTDRASVEKYNSTISTSFLGLFLTDMHLLEQKSAKGLGGKMARRTLCSLCKLLLHLKSCPSGDCLITVLIYCRKSFLFSWSGSVPRCWPAPNDLKGARGWDRLINLDFGLCSPDLC